MAVFEEAVYPQIAHEGGYSNNPKDPGGETKYGISKRAYPEQDIKNLTIPQAVVLYKKDYWKFDAVSSQLVANKLFATVVQFGVVSGIEFVQMVISKRGNVKLKIDGIFGPITTKSLNEASEALALQFVRTAMAIGYAESLAKSSTDSAFIAGWMWWMAS